MPCWQSIEYGNCILSRGVSNFLKWSLTGFMAYQTL